MELEGKKKKKKNPPFLLTRHLFVFIIWFLLPVHRCWKVAYSNEGCSKNNKLHHMLRFGVISGVRARPERFEEMLDGFHELGRFRNEIPPIFVF